MLSLRKVQPVTTKRAEQTQFDMLTAAQLKHMDRWQMETASRARVQPVYIGDETLLTRILGRYKFYVHAHDVGFGAHVLLDGIWEAWITQFIAREVSAGQTVVDVGANHGYYTVLMADMVGPEGHVVAFEPNPTIGQLLTKSVAVNGYSGRTKIHRAATTAKDGEDLSFIIPKDEPKNGHLIRSPHEKNAITVKGITLDTALEKCERVDFIKIDVEGAEEGTLAGAWKTIERHRPGLLLEFNARRTQDPESLIAKLRSYYPTIKYVDFYAKTIEIDDKTLLDRSYREDWMLYLKSPK